MDGRGLGRKPRSSVLIVEPDADLCIDLRSQFSHFENVRVVECALSDHEGSATLFSDRPGSGLASLAHRDLRHVGLEHSIETSVRTMTLGALMSSQNVDRIDVLKLDIEGHELAVLRSAAPFFPKIGAIQFEFRGANIDTRTYLNDCWYLLAPHYQINRISPHGLQEVPAYSEADEVFSSTNFACFLRR